MLQPHLGQLGSNLNSGYLKLNSQVISNQGQSYVGEKNESSKTIGQSMTIKSKAFKPGESNKWKSSVEQPPSTIQPRLSPQRMSMNVSISILNITEK